MKKSKLDAMLKVLAVSCVSTAVVLMAGPALADHRAGHDMVARGGIISLADRVSELEQDLNAITHELI